ncbi:extracellular solute-binding protein [Kineosporia sp. J2-2]|uniref:Extracellular solute-binding protein n=1 Tax=Kineosporia corallincola TaxID=2835133 RepID=A0ABS5TBU2_9ACTN|nr:extracellular solute-binding protein [Kineosporia corallincola]MBT0768540.1 extracellular solute-binding protein [Kineosporia corallincola]
MDRRSLFKAAGVGAFGLATGSVLGACGGGSGGDVSNAGKDLAAWPSYVPFAGPPPDAPGDESTGVQALYRDYPADLVRSVQETVGDGSDVTAMVVSYGAPPKALEKNRYWQAINQALNVNLKVVVVPDPEYAQKMTTLMASGSDLPDIVMFTNLNLPRRAEFIRRSCADLSDLLAGDAVKDYPNLANLPTYAWKGMGRIGGRIYGVPLERPMPANSLFVNRDMLNAAGAPVNWDKDQYLAAMAEVSTGNHWGIGWYKTLFGGLGGITYHAGSFGAPNTWSSSGGGFTHTATTGEFQEALAVMRQLADAGSQHPDSATASSTDMQNFFYNGTVASMSNGFGSLALQTLTQIDDRFGLDLARPYTPDATPWQSSGTFGFATFKKAAPDRIRMLLRICDYLSAPFGTTEYELANYGVEGVHFTKDDGVVRTTKLYDTENSVLLPVRYIGTAPTVLHLPGHPDVAQAAYDWEKAVLPRSVANPANGLQSTTLANKGAQLDQILGDGIAAITFGRKPVSAWPGIVSDWKKAGGDQLAEELAAEARAAA